MRNYLANPYPQNATKHRSCIFPSCVLVPLLWLSVVIVLQSYYSMKWKWQNNLNACLKRTRLVCNCKWNYNGKIIEMGSGRHTDETSKVLLWGTHNAEWDCTLLGTRLSFTKAGNMYGERKYLCSNRFTASSTLLNATWGGVTSSDLIDL